MDRYKGYYNELLAGFPNEMSSYKKIMLHDIHRTGNKELPESTRERMLRILFSFAKRNMEIGYCQGMNFLCYFLLEMGFEEEQTFWIICYVFERLIPHNYLINMIPIIADIELLRMMLDKHVPKLMNHLTTLSVDLNFILLPFFVTAFTSIKNFAVRLSGEGDHFRLFSYRRSQRVFQSFHGILQIHRVDSDEMQGYGRVY